MVGQFKVPITRARIASTATLAFVERPLLDGEFVFDRDRGANVQLCGGARRPRDGIDPIGDRSMPRTREVGGAASWFAAGHPYDLCLDVHRVTVADDRSVRARLQLEIAL